MEAFSSTHGSRLSILPHTDFGKDDIFLNLKETVYLLNDGV